jgi:hypothetical protein
MRRGLHQSFGATFKHYRTERPHQGKGNVILFPSAKAKPELDSPIECRERLGGLLTYYHRKAA